MKRINYYLLLLATMLCVSSLNAQKEYSIDCVTVINLGDGRILHRDISGNKPLNGEHRIIDGYHSAYILAGFKDGLYNGDYEEYVYNKLKAKGSYKEGWKNGIFKKFDDEGRVTEENPTRTENLMGYIVHSIQTASWKWSVSTKKENRMGRICIMNLTELCGGNITIRMGNRLANNIHT